MRLDYQDDQKILTRSNSRLCLVKIYVEYTLYVQGRT